MYKMICDSKINLYTDNCAWIFQQMIVLSEHLKANPHSYRLKNVQIWYRTTCGTFQSSCFYKFYAILALQRLSSWIFTLQRKLCQGLFKYILCSYKFAVCKLCLVWRPSWFLNWIPQLKFVVEDLTINSM